MEPSNLPPAGAPPGPVQFSPDPHEVLTFRTHDASVDMPSVGGTAPDVEPPAVARARRRHPAGRARALAASAAVASMAGLTTAFAVLAPPPSDTATATTDGSTSTPD